MCGRRLRVPPGDKVRPTQDRVREALFSMLMAEVPECDFVDLYAGSGSVGLEALSRGARRVTWVEKDPRNVALIRRNAEELAEGRGEPVCDDAARWARRGGAGRLADIVFADPPYVLGRDQGFGELMAALAQARTLRAGGLFVAEMPEAKRPDEAGGWELLRDRIYGHTRLVVYRLAAEEAI